jgi:hypothetical protein
MNNSHRGRHTPTPPLPYPGSGEPAFEWAYSWNAPRKGVGSPFVSVEEQKKRDRINADLAAAFEHLNSQPGLVKRQVNSHFFKLEQSQGIQRAHAYLTLNFVKRALPRLELVNKQYRISKMTADNARYMARFNHLADMSRSDVEALAEDVAAFIAQELGLVAEQCSGCSDLKTMWLIYRRAGIITRDFRQLPPLWEKLNKRFFSEEDAGPAVSRMLSPQWWLNRLRRTSAEWREHLNIAQANVSKKTNPYASKTAITEWREQKRRTREFLKGMELEDEAGNRISLIDKYDGSVANPAIRRSELMVRIRGFENICNDLGYVGEFYTITAPSKFHATNKHGHRNRKWNGASPAETQCYLRSVWSKIRAKLHREDLRIFGIRVAEPHHDGTPHWHMLIFMQPEDVGQVREIMRDYATQEDARELSSAKARKGRFHAEVIDPEQGSATGYVAKYISKNIDGYQLDGELDDESGKPLKESAAAVSAWAARWRIRQFQFIGGAPVTVYRELRRMADHEAAIGLSVEFAAVHDAADVGNWAEYINAQGGPFVKRDDLVVRTYYEAAEETNGYGEDVMRVRGVFSPPVGQDVPIITRITQWKIVPKKAPVLGVDLQGAPAPSRSSVNNCTGDPGGSMAPPDIGEADYASCDIDFGELSAKERRKVLARIRNENSKTRISRPRAADAPAGAACAMEKIRGRVEEIAGIQISDSECQLLAKGMTMKIAGNHYYGNSRGDLFTARAPVRAGALMQRFNRLRQKLTGQTGDRDLLLKQMEKEGNKQREKLAQELSAVGKQAPAIEEIDRLLLGGTVKIGAFYFCAGADGRLYGRRRK